MISDLAKLAPEASFLWLSPIVRTPTPPPSPPDESNMARAAYHHTHIAKIKNKHGRPFPIMKVPMEIMDVVFDYCEAETLANFQLTCRAMRAVLRPILWNEVHIEFDGRGKRRSATCLAPPTFKYRAQAKWYMNIDASNVGEFINCMKNDDLIYLFWTRHLMIKSPVELDESMHGDAKWLLSEMAETLTALDSLDVWGLTPEWYPQFGQLFGNLTMCNKSLHWIKPAVEDCVQVSNLKAMTLHDKLMDNLYFAFDLEEFNFYSGEYQNGADLAKCLLYCSQLKRVALHIPGIESTATPVEWLPVYVKEYEQVFQQHTESPKLFRNNGVKFLRSTIPEGKLTQDMSFAALQRLSIHCQGGAPEVCPDLFKDCTQIKELVLEDMPLSLVIESCRRLQELQSLICRGGVLDGVHDSPKSLPEQLQYLIIKPNHQYDSAYELTHRAGEYIAQSDNKRLRVFVDVPYELNHPHWRLVADGMVSDGFAHYVGDTLYERVF